MVCTVTRDVEVQSRLTDQGRGRVQGQGSPKIHRLMQASIETQIGPGTGIFVAK